ncbi:hypothetical protein [Acidihalobacter prosperus]|nr:hypothetical protein [Acidihalobacter prosperus]
MLTMTSSINKRDLLAALLLPPPEGELGWRARDLGALLDREPHQVSLALQELKQHRVVQIRGVYSAPAEHRTEWLKSLDKAMRPTPEDMTRMAQRRQDIANLRQEVPRAESKTLMPMILGLWSASDVTPMNRNEILEKLRERHGHEFLIGAHPVSQMLHVLVREGRILSTGSGKATRYWPATQRDLFSIASGKAASDPVARGLAEQVDLRLGEPDEISSRRLGRLVSTGARCAVDQQGRITHVWLSV